MQYDTIETPKLQIKNEHNDHRKKGQMWNNQCKMKKTR